jgi:hypothetical protein
MPTDVIKVIPKTTYDFTSGGSTHVVCRALDVTDSSSGSLLVRSHDHSISSGGSIDVVVRISAPSHEDPSIDFVGNAVATATLDSSTPAAPLLLKDDLDPSFGGFLWVEVVGTKGSGTTKATISCDLAMIV